MARVRPTTTFTSTSSSSCSPTTDPSSPCGWTARAVRVPTAKCRSMTGSASTTRSARWHPRRLSPCAARTCAGVATRRAPFEPTNGRSFPLLCARPNAPQKSRRRPTTANSPDRVASGDEDLGSREALADYSGPLAWYPAEVNTSTRTGWFHHDVEDSQVRSVDELFSIWKGSVGGNATFLLNVPPNRDGLLADADVQVLARLGEKIADFHARRVDASREDEATSSHYASTRRTR